MLLPLSLHLILSLRLPSLANLPYFSPSSLQTRLTSPRAPISGAALQPASLNPGPVPRVQHIRQPLGGFGKHVSNTTSFSSLAGVDFYFIMPACLRFVERRAGEAENVFTTFITGRKVATLPSSPSGGVQTGQRGQERCVWGNTQFQYNIRLSCPIGCEPIVRL